MTIEDLTAKGIEHLKSAAFDILAQKENLEAQLQAIVQAIRDYKPATTETPIEKPKA